MNSLVSRTNVSLSLREGIEEIISNPTDKDLAQKTGAAKQANYGESALVKEMESVRYEMEKETGLKISASGPFADIIMDRAAKRLGIDLWDEQVS